MAGAFRDEDNAQRVFEDLSEKGYKAKRIERNKHGLYPVLYGSFSTYAEAEKLKNEIRAKENPEAWILIESL
jgi:cell division protein FtsN